MSEFFLNVVNMSISASWIVLAVLLLRWLLKKAPKWIIVLLWGIVAVRLICPFSIESVMSLIPSAETISPEIMVDNTPVINSGIPIINNVVNPVIEQSFSPAPDSSANPLQILISVLSVTWVVGIAVMLVYTGISYYRIKSKIGTAVLLRDNVFQSENVVSPFVLGIIKPRIYLPFNMNEQDVDYVIAHENAHISRKDHLWKPFGFLVLTLHWFNPLMWLGYVLLCRDIELACDEKVVKEFDAEQKADYSQALLTCSVNRRVIAACPLAFGEVGVKDRVKSVLSYKKPAFWIILVAIIASVVVAVCFLTNPASSDNNELPTDTSDTMSSDTSSQPDTQKQPTDTSDTTSSDTSSQPDTQKQPTDSPSEKDANGLKITVVWNSARYTATAIEVTDKSTNKIIQKITLGENAMTSKDDFYIIDVNFDRKDDIIIPYQRPARAAYYSAYVWDASTKQFVHAQAFEELSNVALDPERKEILSSQGGDKSTSYSVSTFDEKAKDFKVQRSLYYYAEGQKMYYFEEHLKNGKLEIVREFTKPFGENDDYYSMDPETQNYYNNHTDWKLSSAKWENYLLKTYNESDRKIISFELVSEKQLSDYQSATQYYDEKAISQSWIIGVKSTTDVKNFRFIELDETEALKVGDTLFELKPLKANTSVLLHTYINDVTLNRGISYQDNNGVVRYFAFEFDLSNGTLLLSEINPKVS